MRWYGKLLGFVADYYLAPPAAVLRISNAIAESLRTDDMRAKLAQQGSEPVGSTPEAFATFITAEIPKWAELVRISGATVE